MLRGLLPKIPKSNLFPSSNRFANFKQPQYKLCIGFSSPLRTFAKDFHPKVKPWKPVEEVVKETQEEVEKQRKVIADALSQAQRGEIPSEEEIEKLELALRSQRARETDEIVDTDDFVTQDPNEEARLKAAFGQLPPELLEKLKKEEEQKSTKA
eukprot:TRINITY_DN6668_c0_g1_i1.p2 TRINITY_DN6668_c0_g1~~TRINITY_DN6668_c0_g1_i1.p2  ORF type:complete len:164 (-),score=46.22 TRINITY_DN6668_c0_g1_i1:777-1238(-)